MSNGESLQPLIAAVAIAVTGAYVVSVAISATVAAFGGVKRGSTLAAAALLFGPGVSAVLLFVALVTPTPFASACHCLGHAEQHPHLCWSHPGQSVVLVGPSALLLLALLVVRSPAFTRVARTLARSVWLTRQLRALGTLEVEGVRVRLADCGRPVAFTVGLLRPLVVVDRLLWQLLSGAQRRAVVHHEHAHALRQDGLTLAAMRVATAFFPFVGARKLLERWRQGAEVQCDAYAAEHVGATTVAETLLILERLQADKARDIAPGAPLRVGISDADLSERVHVLLARESPPESSAGAALMNDGFAIAIVALALGLLAAFWPGGFVHHAAETIAGLLLR